MDDLSSKITEMFSSPEGMEKIKNLVNMLSSSSGGESGPSDPEGAPDAPSGGGTASSNMPDFDPAMLMSMKKAMDIMRKGDPRIDLLLALKENLSEPRRKRVDEAIQLMRVINLMPLLREQGFLHGPG